MESRGNDYTRYKKTVVMLYEENADFANNPSHKIHGDLKIETGNNKGAMSLSVKNLRTFERNRYIYKLILFGEKKERTIYTVIGTLSLNRHGEGENYFRFSPNDIDGKGNNLDDYTVAIVAAVSMRNDKEPLHPVLKGVLDNAPNHNSHHRKSKSPQSYENKEHRKYGEVLVNATPHSSQSYKTYNDYYADFLKERCSKLLQTAENIDEINPFTEDKTHGQWKKMTGSNGFPIVSSGAQKNISRYGHYLFGHHDELYFFAVPGRFIDEECPENGRSGFALWQPIRGAEALDATKEDCPLETRMAAYGYWILAVRKDTGEIVDIQ